LLVVIVEEKTEKNGKNNLSKKKLERPKKIFKNKKNSLMKQENRWKQKIIIGQIRPHTRRHLQVVVEAVEVIQQQWVI